MIPEDIEQSCDDMMKFFEFSHLPPNLQNISMNFHTLAYTIMNQLPNNEEKLMALRKLLEAKDCAVRACL